MTIERAINLLAGQRDAYCDCMSNEELEAYKMAIGALKICGKYVAMSVVRCKDCKYYDGFMYCEKYSHGTLENKYCAEGEKKNDRNAD